MSSCHQAPELPFETASKLYFSSQDIAIFLQLPASCTSLETSHSRIQFASFGSTKHGGLILRTPKTHDLDAFFLLRTLGKARKAKIWTGQRQQQVWRVLKAVNWTFKLESGQTCKGELEHCN